MRLLQRITLPLAIIALLGSSGCAKNIGATYDPFFLFPSTAQWAWDEDLIRVPDDPSVAALNIPTIVRELMAEALASHGYVAAPVGGKTDFRAHYQVGIGRKITPSSATGYGSLSLTLVDDATNRNVWVGFVKTESDISMPEAERRERLKKQINQMLKEFPPSQPN